MRLILVEFCGKLIANGITKDKLYQALDTLSQLCNICDSEDCSSSCPLKFGDKCLFMVGKDKIYQNVAQIFESEYADRLADMLGIKINEPFDAIINGKAESCMLCHDGMHYKGKEAPSPKLLEDIITGAVRIVK